MKISYNPFAGSSLAGITQTYPDAINWWEQAGAEDVAIVYQPKGASSLANSYVDLSGNGNDASPGVAPSWDAVNGWSFNGTSQYLTTGYPVTPSTNDITMLIQFTGASKTSNNLAGVYGGLTNMRFQIGPVNSSGTNSFFGNGNFVLDDGPVASGNLGIAGFNGFRDGQFRASMSPGMGVALNLFVGCINNSMSPADYTDASIQAFVLYEKRLTVPEVYEVARRMAEL